MSKIAEICVELYNDWEADLPDIETLPDPVYSKKHVRKMNNLFDKMRGNEYHHFTRRTIRVMVAAALISALALCAFAVPSSRDIVADKFREFSNYYMTEDNNNAVVDIEVGYVPSGFELVEEGEATSNFYCTYESLNGGTLYIDKSCSGTILTLNTEGGTEEKITIDNITYSVIINPEKHSNVIWTDNDYIYCVSGNISKEELLKTAKNVK